VIHFRRQLRLSLSLEALEKVILALERVFPALVEQRRSSHLQSTQCVFHCRCLYLESVLAFLTQRVPIDLSSIVH